MSPADFTPIRISTLRGDIETPFDVFVKIADKFILYCRAGSTFEGARLERLKSKKLKAMYVRKGDEIPYRQYLEASIDAAYNNKSAKPIRTRVEVIQGFQQAAVEEFLDDPTNAFAYDHVRSSVERFAKFLEAEPGVLAALLDIANTDRSITHHGVAVAAVAIKMALHTMKNDKLITIMGLGALIHDLDHFYEGRDPSQKDTPAYLNHPLAGAARLQQSPFVDQTVFNIISQHEEQADGSGFPRKLREKDMDPLVINVALANAYERLISFEGLDPKAALKHILIHKLGAYPLPFLQTLQAVLKADKVV